MAWDRRVESFVVAVATRECCCEGGRRNREVGALRFSGVSLSKHWPLLANRVHLHHLLCDSFYLRLRILSGVSETSALLPNRYLHQNCIRVLPVAAVWIFNHGTLMMSPL